jgi:hypothetical protein
MKTNGEYWRAVADQQGIPLRTLADVTTALEKAKKTNADEAMARLMLKHGRLTDEARSYLAYEYL